MSNNSNNDSSQDLIEIIIYSEFVWGLFIGIILTFIGSLITARLIKKQHKSNVKSFCVDSISNISEYVEALDNHRDRARVIHKDFLELIEVEMNVYGRNREHLIHIENRDLRKKVRDFFTDIAVQLAKIKENIELFNKAYNLSNQDLDGKKIHEENAAIFLKNAHASCDRLVQIATKKDSLLKEL